MYVFFFHNIPAVFQVNGTLVTHSNHIEVVKLIKCKVLFFTFVVELCFFANH